MTAGVTTCSVPAMVLLFALLPFSAAVVVIASVAVLHATVAYWRVMRLKNNGTRRITVRLHHPKT